MAAPPVSFLSAARGRFVEAPPLLAATLALIRGFFLGGDLAAPAVAAVALPPRSELPPVKDTELSRLNVTLCGTHANRYRHPPRASCNFVSVGASVSFMGAARGREARTFALKASTTPTCRCRQSP